LDRLTFNRKKHLEANQIKLDIKNYLSKFGPMKKVLLYILSLFLLIQAGWGYVIIGTFYANKDYITKYLCENRDKPSLHCNGNCVLMKKIRKAEERERQNPSAKIKAETYDFVDDYAWTSPTPVSTILRTFAFGALTQFYVSRTQHTLLRPPIA